MNKNKSENKTAGVPGGFVQIWGILGFLIMMVLTLALSVKTYGAELTVEASDEQGYPVRFNEDNHAKNAGDVIFKINTSGLKNGQSLVYDDGGIISEVEDGTYVMSSSGREEGEEAFVNFYISSAEGLKEITKKPYLVEFYSRIRAVPKAAFHSARGGEDAYVEISPSDWVNTFFILKDVSGTTKKHITKQTRISFPDEGEYTISAYTIDGKGNRTLSEELPEKVTIDETPPVIGDIVIDKPVSDDGTVLSNEKVTISVSATDDISGLEGIYMIPEGEEPVKASVITINPPYKGNIQIMARDKAGNETESMSVVKWVIADNAPPVIGAENRGFSNGVVKLSLSAADDLSGVKKLKAVYDGKTVFENDGKKEEFLLDVKNMGYEEQKVFLTAWDRAGNKAEGSLLLQKYDTEPPRINFYGAADRGIYGEDTEVYVEVSDDSGKTASYSANVYVSDPDGKMLYSSTTDSRSLRITKSGIVTITAVASDQDQNMSKRSISFIIDKDAPVIRGVEDYDGMVLESFKLEDEGREMVEDISCVTCEVYLNGLEYDGKTVTKDGKYVLRVSARDEFGNTSVKEADFMIKNEKEKEVIKKAPQVTKKRPSGGDPDKKVVSHNSSGKKAVSSDSMSLQALSGSKIPKDGSKTGGISKPQDDFLSRLKYAIIKMFGLKQADNTI